MLPGLAGGTRFYNRCCSCRTSLAMVACPPSILTVTSWTSSKPPCIQNIAGAVCGADLPVLRQHCGRAWRHVDNRTHRRALSLRRGLSRGPSGCHCHCVTTWTLGGYAAASLSYICTVHGDASGTQRDAAQFAVTSFCMAPPSRSSRISRQWYCPKTAHVLKPRTASGHVSESCGRQRRPVAGTVSCARLRAPAHALHAELHTGDQRRLGLGLIQNEGLR